jgi:hypothetical protein
VFVVVSFVWAAEIYKWVDEKGIVHYSDVPPPDKKAEEVEIVDEKTGVSTIGTPTAPPAKTQPTTTTKPSSTTQSAGQVDVSVDEYGNRHPITDELIAQERVRLEEKLRYYKNECPRQRPDSDGHKRWCAYCAESIVQDLKDLAKSPKLYFYSKYEREKKRVQRKEDEAQKRDSVFNPKTGEYYPRSGNGYINQKTGEYYPSSGNGAINPKTGEYYE